ncbi:MAG: GTP 3',8-cyclase MoaA [Firmicutes bacterium]|nr:GTP 3',8-cyclase MoaA [Bacillota bacterium]
MKDSFGREISYLRISLTDKCNLRCRYCMPEEGVCLKDHSEMLTEDEFVQAAEVAAELGIRKIRLTGGEPLVKKNIIGICARISAIPGIEDIGITTNGLLLPKIAKDLAAVGVTRVNISLDTLKKDKFEYLSRRPAPEDLMGAVKAALEAGFKKVKINAVLIGGVNDDEIEDLAALTMDYPVDVRFIELMPMYDSGDFGPEAYLDSDIVLERLSLLPSGGMDDGGVAKKYKLPGAKGEIGLISAVSKSFCSSCNRIRLTADGFLKPCLHSSQEIGIKGLAREEVKEKMKECILAKPPCHPELSYEHRSGSERNMNRIGG